MRGGSFGMASGFGQLRRIETGAPAMAGENPRINPRPAVDAGRLTTASIPTSPAPDDGLSSAGDASHRGRSGDLQTVVAALTAVEDRLGPDWLTLLEADALVQLQIRIVRARERRDDALLQRAGDAITGLQRVRLHAELDRFEQALISGDLEAARAILAGARRLVDRAEPLDDASLRLSDALARHADEAEGRAILQRAREMSAPQQPPRRLKQALRVFDDLLRRLGDGAFADLGREFETIREERDAVQGAIRAAEDRQSSLATVVAMGEIDDLVEVLDVYRRDLEVGRLDEAHVRDQVERIEDDVRHRLTAKLEEHLEDSAEIARNPRDAHIALERLREHRDKWRFLSARMRRMVEARDTHLAALVERRDAVLARCEEAARTIAQDPAGALLRLESEVELNPDLQIDAGRHTSRAVERLLHLHTHTVERLEAQLEDMHLPERELPGIVERATAVSEALTPVSASEPALAALATRAVELIRRAQQAAIRIEQCDAQLTRIQALADRGHRDRARERLATVAADCPPQRKSRVADLKDDLELAVLDDEIEMRLSRLIMDDATAAVEWAERHPGHPACRSYLEQRHFTHDVEAVLAREAAGQYTDALVAAMELRGRVSDSRQAYVESIVRRLQAVETDGADVRQRLENAREAELSGRLGQVAELFDVELAIPVDLRDEWSRLATRARMARGDALTEQVTDAVSAAREARQRLNAPGMQVDDPLSEGAAPEVQPDQQAQARRALETALVALEDARPAAQALRADESLHGASAMASVRNFDLEFVLCGAELALARRDFEGARRVLAEGVNHPGADVLADRIARAEFGWRLVSALGSGGLDTARALIESHREPLGEEAQRARRLLEEFGGIRPSGPGKATAAEALERHRANLLRLRRIVSRFSRMAPHLARLQQREIQALVAALQRRFAEIKAEPMRGGALARYRLLHDILIDDGLHIDEVIELQGEVALDLKREGDDLVSWLLEANSLRRPSGRDVEELQSRLELLGELHYGGAPGQRFLDARTRLQQVRTDVDAVEGARRNRDALMTQAMNDFDRGPLAEAARIEAETDGLDARARPALIRWDQGDRLAERLRAWLEQGALTEARETALALEQVNSPVHTARLSLPDPRDPSRRLPPGIDAVLEALDAAEAERKTRHRALVREVERLQGRAARWWVELRIAVARLPRAESRSFGAAVGRLVARAQPELTSIRADLACLEPGNSAEREQVQALGASLPLDGGDALDAAVRDQSAAYRNDRAFLLAVSQQPLNELAQVEGELARIVATWQGVPELEPLVRAFSWLEPSPHPVTRPELT